MWCRRGEYLFAWAFQLNSISLDIMGGLRRQSFKFKFSKELCHLAKLLDVGRLLWICGFVLVFYGGICD